MQRAGTANALVFVCTALIISAIAYLPVTGLMGATKSTTVKVNATHGTTQNTNTNTNKNGVPKPNRDFLTPFNKGMSYFSAGNYSGAIPYFDKVLAINPNFTLALNNKGASLDGLGIYNASIAYFDKALSINPRYTAALYNKGAALSKLGIYNESIAYFDKVLAIQPTNALALAGKKLDLAAMSKPNIIAKPQRTVTAAAPQIPPSSQFGYFFKSRPTNTTTTTTTTTTTAPASQPRPPLSPPTNVHKIR